MTIATEPRVVHALPGRLRLHLSTWSGEAPHRLEQQLRPLPGVRSVRANPATSNVLIHFDPQVTSDRALIAALQRLEPVPAEATRSSTDVPPARHESRDALRRVRVAMRGLDRDPALPRRVEERLARWPGVRARANPLTGRVLIELAEHATVTVAELVADVADLEPPALPGEARPRDPLDPESLRHGLTRTVGAALGLGLLAARRMVGAAGPPVSSNIPALVADIIGILRGFPTIRYGIRRLLGPDLADLLFSAASVTTQALSANPLGLIVNEVEGLQIVSRLSAHRAHWRQFEERLIQTGTAQPGTAVTCQDGERALYAATVIEGAGFAIGYDGLPVAIGPGDAVVAGAPLYGGPFRLRLHAAAPFTPTGRPAPPHRTLFDRYLRMIGPASLGYAVATSLLSRSPGRFLTALTLVSPRPALIGAETADHGAYARLLRAGVTVIGARPERSIRRPHFLLLDAPRLLVDGYELEAVVPLSDAYTASDLLALAAAAARTMHSPWSLALRGLRGDSGVESRPDVGSLAELGLLTDPDDARLPPSIARDGAVLLLLRHDAQPIGVLVLRPRLAPGVAELVQTCRRHGVELALLRRGDAATAQQLATRAGVALLPTDDALAVIHERQRRGDLVAYVADGCHAAEAFATCDLAIGLVASESALLIRADLLVHDLGSVIEIVETGTRRDAAVRDAVLCSALSNVVGLGWGIRPRSALGRVSDVGALASLAAMAVGWLRLRGGHRLTNPSVRITDPRPERWGEQPVADVLRAFATSPDGLTSSQAAERQQTSRPLPKRHPLLHLLIEQVRSPLIGIMAAGAGLSLVAGNVVDVGIILATILANVAISSWQEWRANQAVALLSRLSSPTARVLRDGQPVTLPASEVVPGDILLLAPGDRVVADARLIVASGLEVDEAALTGESLPVAKSPHASTAANRIVLEGSDVTIGTGQAIVVGVGQQTRLGALTTALAIDDPVTSPLGQRLRRMLDFALPISAASGLIVLVSGLLRRRPLATQVSIGASTAIAAVPEGLPLLAKMGEAATARRLAARHALVHRLSAIEALGRVSVVCVDKTGTMTDGRLALHLIANGDECVRPGDPLTADLRHVLLTAALASPHPDDGDATAHPTDVAILRGAWQHGLSAETRVRRDGHLPFDPTRAYHAARINDRVCLKGAPEVLAPRCRWLRRNGGIAHPLDSRGQADLLAHAEALARQGLRVLLVAEGPPATALDDPQELTALGFVGIADPLRPAVPAAVQRCHAAGVRVIMITGDHPETARAIAREAGLPGSDEVLTGADLAQLADAELDERMARVSVIARATPLDKMRVIESLKRLGETVAMTGDGVNDAPALRLADVGVAMGHGTEVARQTADLIIADDNFVTVVEALVEGRSFWRNVRRAVSLLLGGNLGELGLITGPSLLGLAPPLTTRQILAVNLITDVLPALAIALQGPEHRHLHGLAREGVAALDEALQQDVLRRGIATAIPAIAAYLAALPAGAQLASTVGFASIIATQLAQTLEMGRAEGRLSSSVIAAVAAAAGLLGVALAMPPLRSLLGLTMLAPLGWLLVAGAALGAVLLSRLLAATRLRLPTLTPSLVTA